MPRYVVTADARTQVPDRDAWAATVRVTCDGRDLGLYQTWVTGMQDLGLRRFPMTSTEPQRRRLVVEALAEALEQRALDGSLRSAWELKIEVADLDPAALEERAQGAGRPLDDFKDGDTIREFTADMGWTRWLRSRGETKTNARKSTAGNPLCRPAVGSRMAE